MRNLKIDLLIYESDLGLKDTHKAIIKAWRDLLNPVFLPRVDIRPHELMYIIVVGSKMQLSQCSLRVFSCKLIL